MMCEHRMKLGIREIIVRLYYECLVTVVRLSYDSPATIVLLKWFMLVPTTMSLSHNSRTTVMRQKNRRAKKVHVQFSSHDSAPMLKISCNCRAIVVWRSQMTRDLTKFHVVELVEDNRDNHITRDSYMYLYALPLSLCNVMVAMY